VKFLRTPLVQFVVLGAGLVVLWRALGFTRQSTREIVISEARVQNLVQSFELVWQRRPTEAELRGLVDDYVREEVLYREAVAMGLDQDDTVIRRRLRQKMEFLAEDVSAVPEPTDEDLRRFLEENGERFRVEPRIGFEHVYVSTDRHGDRAKARAEELLSKLRVGAPPTEMGDPFLLPSRFESQTPGDVARTFGDTFSEELFEAEPSRWTGPIASGYGLHLVFVTDRIGGRTPTVSEVRDGLRQEWMSVRRREANDAFYHSLRNRYRVKVEVVGWERE
jgi:hypothetical protein